MRLAILGDFVDSIIKRAETRDYTNRLRGEARRLGLSRLHGRPSPTASFSTAGGAAGRGLSSALQRTCCPMRRRGEEGGSGGPLHGAVRSGWRVAAGPLVVFAALLALPPQTQAQTVTTPAGPIPTLQCHNGDSREGDGGSKFDATMEIRPGAVGFELDAIQVTKPSTYFNYLMAVAPSGQPLNRWVLRVQLIDAVTGNAVPYEDARGQFSLQVRADSFTSSHGVYNEASNILRYAFNPLATMPDASATHGTDGTIDFTVTLDAVDDCQSVTVDWATADGTATAGEDYAAASGTLTFGPGETSKTIRVALLETADVDGSETFSVQLSNASGITLDDAETIGTISGVKAANVPATGKPTVTGTARVGETLAASASDIADDDGVADAAFAWQWIANDADIAGATGATYTLMSAEVGKTVKVRATFTDDRGTEETVLSDATAAVEAANVPATGKPTVAGTARVGETLAASASGISDDDGLANAAFAWQWIANDADIAGATGATYTLMSAEMGKTVKVRAIFTDDRGAEETVLSDATAAVEAAVPPAIVGGGVQVTSAPQAASDTYGPGETITLTVTFDKAVTVDTTGGMPRIQFRLGPPRTDRWAEYSGGSGNTALTFTYEVQSGDMDSNGIWLPKNKLHLRSGTIRDAATNTADAILSYARAGLQSGHKVDGSLIYTPEDTGPPSVSVQCVDMAANIYGPQVSDHQSLWWELHFSEPVARDDDTTTRSFAITGQDDTDFTWFAIGGPADFDNRVHRWGTTPKVSLLQGAADSDVNGVVITVPAGRWEDMSGNLNTASANSLYLAHNWKVSVADASATEGADGTIDFEVTLNARDDCKTVTVDWLTADGTATAGEDYAAASGTLTFGPGESSKTIRVALLDTADVDGAETFSVQLGNASDITLDDAEAIGTISGVKAANVPATGKPTVTGTARVGEMLTASASDIADDDGLTNATFAWQWIADDADIVGATEATYTLTSAEEGKTVKVRATFTDDRDTEETVLSDATAAVTTAYTCTAPNLAGRTEVWTGTLTVATVERGGAVIGYGFNGESNGYGMLSDTSFDFGGTSYAITAVVRAIAPSPIPALVVMLDKSLPDTERKMLRLHVCGDTFDLASVSVNHPNLVNRDKRYSWPATGIDWSSATTVSLALSGTINQAATGAPAIAGTAQVGQTPQVGQTLTAGPGDIADPDGIASATFSHQWVRVDGTTETDIMGATGATYTLVAADVGKTVKVRATFTDDRGTEETVLSEATAAVALALPVVSVVAVSSPVTEGTAAAFTLRRTGDTAAALTVAVSVAEEGAVLSGTPASTVTFAAGSAEVRLSVATVDDSVAEADARVAVAVTAGSGYQLSSSAGSAGVDVYDNDGAASTSGKTLWTSTIEWQDDYGNGWVNANAEDFSSPGWSEDGEACRIWYIAYGSASRELWLRVNSGLCAGGIPEPETLTLQVGGVTVGSGDALSTFARGSIGIARNIQQNWAVGDRIEVRLTRTEAGETVASGPGISVEDAQVREAEGAALAFRVTLDAAQTSAVSVRYATSDGTATAGADYELVSGALRFEAGETAKTVSVPVLNDAHDEGSETLTLALSAPFGAEVADGTATGTIVNTGPIPRAWITRFGRTVGLQAIEAIGDRLSGSGGTEVVVGGVGLSGPGAYAGTPLGEEADWPMGPEDEAWSPDGDNGRGMTGRELLLGSSFRLGAGGEDGAPSVTAWGRVASSSFDGEEAGMSLSGDVTTGFLGADMAHDSWLAGLAVGVSEGEGSFDDGTGDGRGTVESSLTSVYPYARFGLGDGVDIWGLVGVGSGDLRLTVGEEEFRTDLSMRMGALGLRGEVVRAEEAGDIELAVKADSMWVRTESDAARSSTGGNLEAASGDVSRVRVALEGSRVFATGSGGMFTPTLELGVRHDAGDAETGTGVEVAAGLRYVDLAQGLTVEGNVRGLLTHSDEGYEEWGASGSVRLDPGVSGRGVSLSIGSVWGAASGGVEQLWSTGTTSGLALEDEFKAEGRLQTELGYGLRPPVGHGVLTPYTGLSLGEADSRMYRVGVRWQVAPEAAVSLEGTRGEGTGAESSESGLMFRAAVRF